MSKENTMKMKIMDNKRLAVLLTVLCTLVLGSAYKAIAQEVSEIVAAKDVAASNADAIADLTELVVEGVEQDMRLNDLITGYIITTEGRLGNIEGQLEQLNGD